MQRTFLITVCAAAIGLAAPTVASSQSAPLAPAHDPSASHFSKARFEALVKLKRSGIRASVPGDGVKRDDSWYKQMRDPCQVEG
jgi:hypothetical protein